MLVLLLFALAAQPGPASADFERGKSAYERGEYGRAVTILRPLLYPEIRLQSEGEVAQTHRMLGVAHLFEKQNDLAAQSFRKLLQLRPEYRFDPLLDPPQVVDFFNGVLRAYEGELAQFDTRRKAAELASKREREALERARNGPTIIEKRYARNSFSVNFIPFGAGQFQNGQRGKGHAFLWTEATLAAVSIGALATNFALYGVRATRPTVCNTSGSDCHADTTDENRSRALTRVQLVSGGLFFAVAAWGIADALLHYQPEVALTWLGRGYARRLPTRLVVMPLDGTAVPGGGVAFRF